MKLTIPAKTVEVCDICQRDGTTRPDKCVVCGKLFCYCCRAIIAGCYVAPDVCNRCGKRDDVLRIIQRYAPDFEKIVKEREAALRRLRKTEKK